MTEDKQADTSEEMIPMFLERVEMCYYSFAADAKMLKGMKAVLLSKHTKPEEVTIINEVWARLAAEIGGK